MRRAKVFLWGSVGLAGVTFVVALAAAIPLSWKMRGESADEARSEDLLQQEREKLAAGDTTGARALVDRILAANPGDPLARSDLARILKGQGDYAGAIAADKIAIATAPDIPDLYYNVACYYALARQKEDALHWLAAAFSHGFGRLKAMKDDADLKILAGDPRFELAARTGKFADGALRVRFHAASRRAKPGEPLELDLVVEREVLPDDVVHATESLRLAFKPDPPLELVSSSVSTVADPGDGVVTLRTNGRYTVRAPREGIFAVPPVKVTDGDRTVESDSLEIEVGS